MIGMVKVEYYYSPVYPYCPSARRIVSEAVGKYSDVEYEEVNTYTEEGIKRGLALNLMSVPAVVVNGVIRLIGFPFSVDDVAKCIEEARMA